MRRKLESSLLHLQEEQLELDDELEGVQELMADPHITSAAGTTAITSHVPTPVKSSRRRKGPAFMPSEHDELPQGVAFMVSWSIKSYREELMLDFIGTCWTSYST
jgi:division protein 1